MKSSSVSILTARTTRVVALFLSVSAIALGGFFISQAYAQTAPNITISTPTANVYWRGQQTVNWNVASTTGLSTISVLYSYNSGTYKNVVTNDPIATVGTHLWDTVSNSLSDGSYTMYAQDNAGGTSSSVNFYLDNTAPTTTMATTTVPDPATGWYNTTTGHTPPQITLTCTDNLSGCSEIVQNWYNATSSALVASATTTSATATIDPSSIPQGDNILVYYSQDKAVDKGGVHNIEAAHSAEFKVDTQAPTVSSYTLNGLAADAYFNPANASTTIALTASEPVTWTTVRIQSATDSSVYQDFHPTNDGQATTTITWNGSLHGGGTAADGGYVITYNIKDAAGNTTNTEHSTPLSSPEIVVDTTPPTITLTAPTDKVYKGAANSDTTLDTSALSFTSSDTNPLTYTYSIDGKATTTPVAAHNDGTTALNSAISGLSDGRHTIVVTITDGAGNSVSSDPVSFVFDNDNTLTVSNNPSDHADFSTIQGAIDAATAGDTIDIFPGSGSYTEDVNVNKALTLKDPPVGQPHIVGTITVASDGVTIDGLDISNPTGSAGIVDTDHSNLTITNNTIHNVGSDTSYTSGSAQAIEIVSNAADVSTIDIEKNVISDVGNSGLLHTSSADGSAKGIYLGNSGGINSISTVTISENTISNVSSSPIPWVSNGNGGWTSKDGGGAYGVLVNHATSGAGETSGLTITNNTISGLEGLWAHAIGLEGNTPGAQVTGNVISGLTDNKGGTDDVGVMVQDNGGAGSVTISANQFAQDIIGVGNEGAGEDPTTATATTTATGNWWGSIDGPRTTPGLSTLTNPHGAGAWVYGPVSFVPWCIDSSCSTIDTSTLKAEVTNAPADPTNDNNPSFHVGSTGSDAVVYYKYQLDGSAWSDETKVATPITASTTLTDGSHTLDLLGRDQAGNWQTTPTTYSWTIDTVPPVLTEVTPVATPTSNKTPSYVFNTTKAGDITYGGGCTGSPTSTTTPGDVTATFGPLADGVYHCTVTVKDSAGNDSNTLAASEFRVDTTPPVINLGPDLIASTTVSEHATVTDIDGSGVATYAWTNESPSVGTITFGTPDAEDTTIAASTDGVYTLQLVATDKAGNTSTSTMSFTWDTTPPVITAPADVTVEATAHMTPLTLTPATATDNLDGSPVITSDAPATFPVGTTTVTWTATDAAGNHASATQDVGIIDTTPPTINGTPSDTPAEATSAAGAPVSWTSPTATDLVDGTDPVTCESSTGLASGDTFPFGPTTVTCNASDKAGNAATPTTFTVTVHDTTAPVIAAHDDIVVTADQLGGKHVTYDAPIASDDVDGPLPAVCTPASGSLFPVNETTTVTCTKTDAHGNSATPTTFTVTVNPDELTTVFVSASPTSLTTADTSTVTVTGQDQYGNTVASDNSTKAVLSTDGAGSLADTILTLANGVAQTTLTSSTAGIVHVNAASGVLTPTSVAVTFTGATVPDTTPPVITNVQSTNIGTSTVEVTWTTNENSTSQVEYGTTSGYGSASAADATLTGAHSVTLSGLTPNTTYHFRVKSADASSNLATSGDNTFTTAVDDNTAVLAVTGIDATRTYAVADGTFENGWAWTFHVTVPTDETQLRMKFDDFLGSPSGTIPVAGNLRFYSPQSSDANATTSAITIAGSGAFSAPMTLTGDTSSSAGRQVDIMVEMRVPEGTAGGSYSTSYGIDTSTSTPTDE